MDDQLTACSNCRCPINYECIRFDIFYHGKYIDFQEFTHNDNYTCDEMIKKEDVKNTTSNKKYSLF